MRSAINECAVPLGRRSAKAVSQDWIPFAEKLDYVLSKMKTGQFLIISARSGNRFVQFACQGEWGMRVEVASNHFLKGKDRLNRRQMSWLCLHGWKAPTGNVLQATPEKDPDGSPNFYADCPAPVANDVIAHQAIEAFIFGLEIPHPAWLIYEARDTDDKSLSFNELGLKRVLPQGASLMERVLDVFRDVTGIVDLELDDDGDISISCGRIHIYTKPMQNKVRLVSVLVSDILESPAVLLLLNQINLRPHSVRCVLRDNTIFATFDIPISPFVHELLAAGLDDFVKTSDALATELRAMFSDNDFNDAAVTSNLIQ